MSGKAVIALLLIAFVAGSLGLTPINCAEKICPLGPLCEDGFEGLDISGCCHICLQYKGDKCGGPFNRVGTCGRGLACQKTDSEDFNAEGVCVEGIPFGGQCGDLWSIQGICAEGLYCQSETPGDKFITNGVCVRRH